MSAPLEECVLPQAGWTCCSVEPNNSMRVHVFETDDPSSTPTPRLGPVRDIDLGQEGSSPRQILDLLRLQFPGVRLFAFNNQDKKLPGWEEVTEATAGNLPAFLAHRKQLLQVPGTKAPLQDFTHALTLHTATKSSI